MNDHRSLRFSPRPSYGHPSGRSFGRRGSAVFVATAALVFLVASSCSSPDHDAQPAPNVSAFVAGGFDDLPIKSGSDKFGPRSEKGDVTSQSFQVEGTTPEEVIEFYESSLDGWQASGRRDVGKAIQEEFRKEGLRLEVSATVTNRGGLDQTQTVQYSLVLHQ